MYSKNEYIKKGKATYNLKWRSSNLLPKKVETDTLEIGLLLALRHAEFNQLSEMFG
jgi:hypothetical protein